MEILIERMIIENPIDINGYKNWGKEEYLSIRKVNKDGSLV